MKKLTIIGAGMAGLLAAIKFRDAIVVDAAEKGQKEEHKALLRFRNESVSRLTGIPFKKVKVRKAVWFRGKLYGEGSPELLTLSNMYSLKVTGALRDRSIHRLSTEERFIAPADFYQMLVEKVGDRINWGTKADADLIKGDGPVISTMPMPAMLSICGIPYEKSEFSGEKGSAIEVIEVPLLVDADIYQTVYFPGGCSGRLYRASVTGNRVILERTLREGVNDAEGELALALSAFGLDGPGIADVANARTFRQAIGKMTPIDPAKGRAYMYELTSRHKVYSLGRFATWRSLLLDDVVDDLEVIERLIGAAEYGASLYNIRSV